MRKRLALFLMRFIAVVTVALCAACPRLTAAETGLKANGEQEFIDLFYESWLSRTDNELELLTMENIEFAPQALAEFQRRASAETIPEVIADYEEIVEFLGSVVNRSNDGDSEDSNLCTDLYSEGRIANQVGSYKAAIDKYTSSRNCWLRRSGGAETDWSSKCLNNIGLAHSKNGDYSASVEILKQALDIRLKIFGPMHEEIANSYGNIGGVYDEYGDYDLALEYYNKALDIALKLFGEKGDDCDNTALLYNNIGLTYYKQGNLELAFEFLQKALTIYNSIEEFRNLKQVPRDTAACYNNMGLVHMVREDFGLAADNFNKAIEISSDFLGRDHPDIATYYINAGIAYDQMGDSDKATENFNEGLNIFVKRLGENHPQVGMAYAAIGYTYFQQEKYDQAIEYFKKSLDVVKTALGENSSSTAMCYNNLGDAYAKMGNAELAQYYLKSGIASQCGEKTEPESGDCRPEQITINLMYLLGRLYKEIDLLDEASKQFNLAADILDMFRGEINSEESKKLFGEKFFELFPLGIGAFAGLAEKSDRSANLEQAFMLAEKGLGRVFLEMLGKRQAELNGGLPDNIISEGNGLRLNNLALKQALDKEMSKPVESQDQATRADLVDKLKASNQEMADYESRLLEQYPAFAELMHPSPRSLSEIRATVLRENEAALEYILGNDASYLLFITRNDLRVVELPPRRKIELQVKNFRAMLTNDDADENQLKKTASTLFETLIGPVAGNLRGYDSLLIVPTDELYFLPFEALVAEFEYGPDYLVRGFNIRYTPSLNVLYLSEMQKAAGRRNDIWIGFGDPVYESDCDDRAAGGAISRKTEISMRSYESAIFSGDDRSASHICRLEGTGIEVKSIGEMFGASEDGGSIQLGFDASESNFKLLAPAGHRYVHIASHGTLGAGQTQQPSLILSLAGNGNTGEDGFLTMTEVFNMRIPADMVVLSACQTGQGKMEKGEGVAGMARAFLYSGADSLVVSLWSVADNETKDLMVDFYSNIVGGETRESALRKAKLEMINHNLLPYFWAPFVFIGIN